MTGHQHIVRRSAVISVQERRVVHLQTFGRLDLHGGSDENPALVTRRTREVALLVYLATAGLRAFRRRDTVLALFWPETPEEQARHTLNQMLYRLRRTLGDGVVISRGPDEIGVSDRLLRCDVAEFRQALDESRWEDALALYEGPFLTGFFVSGAPGLERWIEDERQEHRRCAREAGVALSEHLERQGDLRGATRWARRAWEIDPCSDSLLRRLLTLLHRQGEHAHAVVLFEEFRQRMAEDYGLEPSAETLELVDSIRAGEAARVDRVSGSPDTSRGMGTRDGSSDGTLVARPTLLGGRGLGGTLAGAGAALLGAAAVFWVFLSSGGSMADSPGPEGNAPVVVVLPVTVSGSVSPDYGGLSRALTVELTTRLGEIQGLLVVPPTSVEPLLRETADPLEVGRRLRGDVVVESSLDWQPSGVETTSRLIDVPTGDVVWGTDHRYLPTEVLSAQLDLTVGVASALNVRLAPIPHRDLTFSSEAELQAWSLASRAKDTIARGTFGAEREEAARALIQKALDLVPDFAPAYAAQASLYNGKWLARRQDSRWLDSAVVAAERAVALDPDHYSSQLALANAMRVASFAIPDRYPAPMERRGAEAALRALQLSPSSPEAAGQLAAFMRRAGRVGREFLWMERASVLRRNWLNIQDNRAHQFWLLGDYESAIEARRLFLELTPRDPHPAAFRIPEYNLSRDRLQDARRQIEAVREQDPDYVGAIAVAVYLDLMTERYGEAEDLIEELLSRDPPVLAISSSNFFPRTALGYVYLKTGRTREGRRLLELVRDTRLDRIEPGSGYVSHYDLARIHAMLGEPEEALHWLQVAIDRGWPFYYTEMGRTDPMLENLLGHEEFERIMGNLKAQLDAEREWAEEMLALPEPERFRQMLMDAERQVETLWEAQDKG